MSGVSKATLGRLPNYLEYLKLVEGDMKTVSATSVAKALGLGEVQVRKDLASVSGEGRPRIGYVTSELILSIQAQLGSRGGCKAVIVGAGKLGRALLDYGGFNEYGIEIAAAFDINVRSREESPTGKPIYPMDDFSLICRMEDAKIGIITVPRDAAQSVADLMVKNGITAIWSFAPLALSVPKNIALKEENLALSLAHLYNQC